MSTISSLGVGSGIDLENLVNALVRGQRAPQDLQLNRRESRAKLELSALGTLRSAVSSLATATGALDGIRTPLRSQLNGPEVASVSLSDRAERATYQLRVIQLASAQSQASEPFIDADTPLGNGMLTVTFGDRTVELDLSEGDWSLRDVRDAINSSDADVQAAVVRDGEGFRLLLTSAQSGSAGEMSFAVSGSLDTRLSSAELTETQTAQDAVFRINGLELTSSSNSVEDVIPGVTLNLIGTTLEEASSTNVSIEPDRGAVRQRVEALVTAYNKLVEETRKLGRFNPETQEAGPLLGNAVLRSVQSRISGVLSGTVDTELEANPFRSLLELGVRTGVDGLAQLDASAFNEAIAQDEGAVEAVLSGFGASFAETLRSFSGSDGIINGRTTALNQQVRRVTQQREALDQRMSQVEDRLRAQFTALDSLVTQFQNTGAFLSQQLAGISDIRL